MKRYTEESKKSTNNNRLKVREMGDMQIKKNTGNDYTDNINRLMMERDNLFEQDSNANNKVDNFGRFVIDKHNFDSNFGEITGDEFEIDEVGRGLPLRSQYSKKRQNQLPDDRFDFDLFDDRPSNLNVSNFDPSVSQGGAGFADVSSSMAKMSSQINPISITSSQIEKLGTKLYYFLFDIYEGSYIVNNIGLFNLFSGLYFSSTAVTEIELKKFFGFPRKEDLHKGLLKINHTLESIEQMITLRNFLILGSDVPYDPHYHDTIRDFCILIRANVERPNSEAKKINDGIKKIVGHNIRNVITPENVENLQLMLITTAVVNPIWSNPFDKVSVDIFHGLKYDEKLNFLHSVGKAYGYFEDNNHQLLEVKCMGGEMTMGFLMFKNEIDTNIDDVRLHFFITHMRESVMDEVKIPMFEQDFKLRYNNSLQNLGLNTVFTKMICPKFFPENVSLQDVVQNVKIIIDDRAVNNKNTGKGYISNKKFVCNVPFMFYFRLIKTDTILMLGMFQ